jgi:hypothetical protein
LSDKEVGAMGAPFGYTPPPVDGFDLMVLNCLPADPRDLPAVVDGVEIRQPTVTDTLRHCTNVKCGRAVWVGEKQRYLLETSEPGTVIVLCYLCAASISGAHLELRSLGPDQPAPPRFPEGRPG